MWRHMGIDAGLFSRRLMGVASEAFGGDRGARRPRPRPRQLFGDGRRREARDFGARGAAADGVRGGHRRGASRGAPPRASCHDRRRRTACCAPRTSATAGSCSSAARPGEREVRAPLAARRSTSSAGPSSSATTTPPIAPRDAMLTTFPLDPGDVLVMGSDGLWDNLSEAEILALVEQTFSGVDRATSRRHGRRVARGGANARRAARWSPPRTPRPWTGAGHDAVLARGHGVLRHGVLGGEEGRHHRRSSSNVG